MKEQLLNLIHRSRSILITSHISPDPDAITSSLLLKATLKANYKDKNILTVLEERPVRELDFLANYNEIIFSDLYEHIEKTIPELIIIVDAMNFSRCSRTNAHSVNNYVKTRDIDVVVIDHHEPDGIHDGALYFNRSNPAAVQEVYELLFEDLDLKKPEDYAELTMLGIISDTARFKYDNVRHKQTFKLISELIDAGASIEKLENQTERYTKNQLKVLSVLCANVTDSGNGYTYSYVEAVDLDSIPEKIDKYSASKAAAGLFTSKFIRSYENNNWGFVIYPELLSGPNTYAASFRSVSDAMDVAAITKKLGGGGHKHAAGVRINAASAKEALAKIEGIILG